MRSSALSTLGVLAFALAACAPTPGGGSGMNAGSRSAPRPCFFTEQITNFRQGSSLSQTIYVRAGRDRVFELRGAGFCRDLDFANTLVIRARFGGGSQLCTGDEAVIGVPGSSDGPCRARVMRELTPEQVAALPSRDRP
jgi:predicted secreted protein